MIDIYVKQDVNLNKLEKSMMIITHARVSILNHSFVILVKVNMKQCPQPFY